ncbi:MAG TPA: hypothetical protein VFX78_04700 [Candidatus Eisenbacteria bacterium]|nr:hypothetical protein [Candidatus Eisenbacteria bacterium]
MAGLIMAAVLHAAVANAAPFDARVIWTRGDRAYLVARDSVWVRAGSRLRFFEKKKEVASGVVRVIEDSTLVVATITAGSLARVKHLDRIRVDAERAPLTRTLLRIGMPSIGRIQPFFECRQLVLNPSAYEVIADTSHGSRILVRPRAKNLPDTLLVRQFNDAADEEIALERGEIDAAVFWPGEASSHIRETMRWTGTPKPFRSRGVVGVRPRDRASSDAIEVGRIPRSAEESLARLNADLFRDDLAPIAHAHADSMAAWSFEVDPKLPGRERILRSLGPSARPTRGAAVLLLTYFDEPTDGSSFDENTVEPQVWLFLLGCPVISRPELRPYLESIDLSAIVNLFDCETAGRKR